MRKGRHPVFDLQRGFFQQVETLQREHIQNNLPQQGVIQCVTDFTGAARVGHGLPIDINADADGDQLLSALLRGHDADLCFDSYFKIDR